MKKLISAALAALVLALGLAGCGVPDDYEPTFVSHPGDNGGQVPVSSAASQPQAEKQDVVIAGLKGPTTMGMVKLMSDAEAGTATHNYDVHMFGTADEIVSKLVTGEIPMAAIPANLASVLYNSSGGKVQVAAINTLGVLYVVETGTRITSVEDLKGKTIYSTGKGTTPEFALNYILEQNGIDPATDLVIEYKSESTEIAALLAETDNAIAVLPQPYATAVLKQNDKLRLALSLTDEWDAVSDGSVMVTGVLAVNTEWAEANGVLFYDFLIDYANSIVWVLDNTTDAAGLIAQYGIVANAAIAAEALPYCNITFQSGLRMREMLEGYLQVLYNQMPESVGGAMPGEDFYYGAMQSDADADDSTAGSDVSDASTAA